MAGKKNKKKKSWKDYVDVNHPSYNKDYESLTMSKGGRVKAKKKKVKK